MKANEKTFVKGNVLIKIHDKNNNLKEEREIKNLVVDTGINYISERMINNDFSPMTHMAAGTDGTTQAANNTGLGNEIGRVVFDATFPQKDGADKIIYEATFGQGVATGGIQEVGIFNAGSNGIMLCRTTFNVVNKDANDTITVIWTIFLFSEED